LVANVVLADELIDFVRVLERTTSVPTKNFVCIKPASHCDHRWNRSETVPLWQFPILLGMKESDAGEIFSWTRRSDGPTCRDL
jgi:hypothetical protein